eukprot:PhM_4_TR8772/c0_g1_i1/m.88938
MTTVPRRRERDQRSPCSAPHSSFGSAASASLAASTAHPTYPGECLQGAKSSPLTLRSSVFVSPPPASGHMHCRHGSTRLLLMGQSRANRHRCLRRRISWTAEGWTCAAERRPQRGQNCGPTAHRWCRQCCSPCRGFGKGSVSQSSDGQRGTGPSCCSHVPIAHGCPAKTVRGAVPLHARNGSRGDAALPPRRPLPLPLVSTRASWSRRTSDSSSLGGQRPRCRQSGTACLSPTTRPQTTAPPCRGAAGSSQSMGTWGSPQGRCRRPARTHHILGSKCAVGRRAVRRDGPLGQSLTTELRRRSRPGYHCYCSLMRSIYLVSYYYHPLQ